MSQLKKKSKNITVIPSQIPMEGYVGLKMYCVCCRHRIPEKGEFRIEDAKKMMEIDKPICQNCANFLKRWQKVEKQKLQSIIDDMKHIPDRRLPLGKNAWLQEWNEVLEKLEGLTK